MSEETRSRQAATSARWWMPLPYTLGRGDEDVRVISRSAFGVYVQLLLSAHARGTIDHMPFVNHHDGLGTIGVVAMREGDLAGGESVREDVDDLIDAGYVTIDETARAIRLHRGLEASRATLDPSPMQPQVTVNARASSPAIHTVNQVETPKKRRARATSLTPSHAATLRNARWYFDHRTTRPRGPWKDAPAGMTFDAWLSTPDGERWSTEKGLHVASTATVGAEAGVAEVAVATPATDDGNALHTTVATPATASVANVGNALQRLGNALQRPPSLTLSPSENTEEKDQTTPCNARVGESVATPDVAEVCNALQKSATPRVATRTILVASEAPITATEFNVAVRERLGARIRPLGLMELEQFGMALEHVSARWSEQAGETVSRDHWIAFIAWLDKGGDEGRGGLSWWKQGKPSLGWLLRGSNLADKFDEAMDWWPERRKRLAALNAPKAPAAARADAATTATISDEDRAAAVAVATKGAAEFRARFGKGRSLAMPHTTETR